MKKKDKGMLEHFLPALLTIMFIAILWIGSLVTASSIDRSTAINHVARKYMLRMEADGYLTPQNQVSLLQELQDLEVEDIDLSGTSLTDVGYGKEVCLKIRGSVTMRSLAFQGLNRPLIAKKKVPLSISKISVAKN